MKRTYSIRYILGAILMLGLSFAAIQFLYLGSVDNEKEALSANIKSVFSDHKNLLNPYHLSQSISSIESFSSLKCSKLSKVIENGKSLQFIDLSFKSKCQESQVFFSGVNFFFDYKASNGDIWRLDGFVQTSFFTKIVLWSLRLLSVVVLIFAFMFYRQKKIAHQRELDIQRLRHQKYIDITRTTQNISHDLKGPIGVMAKVLEASSWVEIQETMPAYKSSLFRLQTMVSSLKDADVDALIRDSWTRFSLGKVVGELQTLYGKANISLTENLSSRIKIDVKKAERSVSNLIINAVEAGAKKIVCFATIVGDSLVISVSDDGLGVPDHIRSRMFERGFTFGKSSGSGLGLSFALATARGHGGDISYTRENGRSSFTMILPNVVSQQDAAAGVSKATEIDLSQPAVPQNWEHRPEAMKLALVRLTDSARQQAISEGLGPNLITNSISMIDSCSLVFTDDLTLVEQCLQGGKQIFFDSSSSVEAAIHKIHHELQKA